ncbi:MAG: hypothetical protein QXX08_04275 [Candidatus Bathyarchaeia archaeon]
MNHRFLLNYPQSERISNSVLDFFLAELTYARSTSDHELWIVSPWITDSNFDLSYRGEFDDIWPGFTKSSISFSYILKKFIDYGSTINFVLRPPHILVPLSNLLAFLDTSEKLAQMEKSFDELSRLLGQIRCLSSDQRKKKTEIDKTFGELYSNASGLRFLLDGLRTAARGQSDVLAFIQDVKNYSSEQVQIFYNYKLHAKILLGKFGGFFGSANITHSGLNYNDELFAFVNDEESVHELLEIARKLAYSEDDWWKRKATRYSISYEYKRQLGGESFLLKVRSKEFPEELHEVLEILGISL